MFRRHTPFATALILSLLTAAASPSFAVDDKPEKKQKLISIVFLLKTPRKIDVDVLRKQAAKTYGLQFGDQREDENVVAQIGDSHYVVKIGDVPLGLINVPKPYVKDPEAAAKNMRELRLIEAMRNHKAWISLDAIGEVADADRDKVYNLIGKLMADLAGDDVLALYASETGKMIWYDNKVREKLRGQNTLSAFDWDDPLIGIDDDDPRMKAAVKKARDSFSDFATAFAARKPGQPFVIKAPFGKGEDTEYMWVEVESIEKDLIKGALANHPIKVKNLKERDKVEVKRSDLTDWAYNDGKPHGMFTESLLRENEEKQQKR